MYSTNYNDFAVNMLAPNHRLPVHSAWAKTLCAGMVWANGNFFEFFVNGDTQNIYDPSFPYGYQDRVVYNGAVYESQQAGNTGNDINDTDWWVLYNDNFIGVYERVRYSASKLIFEYALNRWFGGTFRQPPSVSDIYITSNASTVQTFAIGVTVGSSFGQTVSSEYIPKETATYTTNTDFTINIPTSLYPAGGDDEIMQFADKINTAGLTYDIVQY